MQFSYTTAEYRCTKCSFSISKHAITLSPPYIILALLATFALSFVLLRAPWSFPLYYFLSIFAGELLALFVAGLPVSLVFSGMARKCPSWAALITFRGQHFTKLQKPLWTDALLVSLFIAINIGTWVALRRQLY